MLQILDKTPKIKTGAILVGSVVGVFLVIKVLHFAASLVLPVILLGVLYFVGKSWLAKKTQP
jgi:hypothetical protein